MRVRDFDFTLPAERIAQAPASARDGARLYVLPRDGAERQHRHITELPALLAERLPGGALLVVNDTRVIPARLRGHKPSGGRVELLLVEQRSSSLSSSTSSSRSSSVGISLTGSTGEGSRWRETWTCLGGASKPLRPGMEVLLDGSGDGTAVDLAAAGTPTARILAVRAQEVDVEFTGEGPGGLVAVAARIGEVPLPPYIKRPEGPSAGDRERYQTVYARVPGSAAAPTAGLHLSPSVLDELSSRGIERASVTLHVGLGTFAPLTVPDDALLEDITELHAERYEVPDATADAIARALRDGRRIIAVGTTTVRALESAALVAEAGPDPAALATQGPTTTRLFIRPGYRFRLVSGMLTNFHLPRSSLMMLVAALAGRERLLAAYADAVESAFRFYSYGDAMLVV